MPSLPAPPAPLLLLGLLLLGSRPARGAGPEHPALPIRPEKEPLPIRGAAGRRWLGAAGGPVGCPGTRGPARSARGGHTAGAGQRPPAKPVPAGCSFGGKVYALDETWHPDLGEPFGVMRCVLCACEAVSGPNGCGRGPCGSGSAEVLGRRMDPELLKRKKPVCRYLG
ncbi:hypothetical protein K5549_003677 [Capra hircus]|nr:hypothetical protein K5549_003677 [Capra hircus]